MNNILEKFARDSIKKGLKKCDDKQILIFKRMYSHKNLDKDIDLIVDDLPEEKLDWAMIQIQNTVTKNGY